MLVKPIPPHCADHQGPHTARHQFLATSQVSPNWEASLLSLSPVPHVSQLPKVPPEMVPQPDWTRDITDWRDINHALEHVVAWELSLITCDCLCLSKIAALYRTPIPS